MEKINDQTKCFLVKDGLVHVEDLQQFVALCAVKTKGLIFCE